jgi:hypothetical protein
MNWLLRFLPQDIRQLVVLGQRIIACLDTPRERREAVQYGIEMLRGRDGASVGDWAKFGSKLGLLRAPQRRPRVPKA